MVIEVKDEFEATVKRFKVEEEFKEWFIQKLRALRGSEFRKEGDWYMDRIHEQVSTPVKTIFGKKEMKVWKGFCHIYFDVDEDDQSVLYIRIRVNKREDIPLVEKILKDSKWDTDDRFHITIEWDFGYSETHRKVVSGEL